MLELVAVLLASLTGIVVLITLMLNPGPPIAWLPRAPSYTFVALFGAAYNAAVVRSWWATGFCIGLAVVFRIGRWMVTKGVNRDVLVTGSGLLVLIATTVWTLAGQPGLR